MNDRGRIKWSPFLIPEHKKRIAKFYEAQDDVKQPEIDEQLIEKLQEVIGEAMQNELEVSITYYRAQSRFVAKGTIQKVDPLTKIIILADREADRSIKVPFREVGYIDLC